MQPHEMRRLLEYDAWATRRLLDSASRLPEGEFARLEIGKQLSHCFLAREGFRGVVGRAPRSFRSLHADFDAMDWTSVERCRAWLDAECAKTEAMLPAITAEALQQPVKVGSGAHHGFLAPAEVVAHLVNHGTHHRSEIARALTEAGHSPGDLDMIVWAREAPGS